MDRFAGLDTQVLGISVDHIPCLTAWAESLGGISYPLLSDFWPHGRVSEMYGVLRGEGYSERALFVISKSGILSYQQVLNIDTQPNNERLRTILRSIDPAAAAREPVLPPIPAALPHGGIVMYCNNWCPDCKRARAWLEQLGLKYTEVNVYRTPGAEEQVRQWCGGNLVTPTFEIDGQVVVDFDEQKLREVLKLP